MGRARVRAAVVFAPRSPRRALPPGAGAGSRAGVCSVPALLPCEAPRSPAGASVRDGCGPFPWVAARPRRPWACPHGCAALSRPRVSEKVPRSPQGVGSAAGRQALRVAGAGPGPFLRERGSRPAGRLPPPSSQGRRGLWHLCGPASWARAGQGPRLQGPSWRGRRLGSVLRWPGRGGAGQTEVAASGDPGRASASPVTLPRTPAVADSPLP